MNGQFNAGITRMKCVKISYPAVLNHFYNITDRNNLLILNKI